MHEANMAWLHDVQARYGHEWEAILEIGAMDWNGTARSALRAAKYVGVDSSPGPCVDFVARAAETAFDELFDCLVCTQVFEHDPTWRDSLRHNTQWLRVGGLLLLSWGAEGNVRHDPEPWAPVPVGDVLQELIVANYSVIESCWESHRYPGESIPGCYNIVARRRA